LITLYIYFLTWLFSWCLWSSLGCKQKPRTSYSSTWLVQGSL